MARPVLLLTGIAEGLGAAIAAVFAGAGHDVIGLSRSDRASDHIKHLVEPGGGRYTHLACDITQAGDIAAALEPHAGKIDIVIHNAHVLAIKPFLETSVDEFEQIWRVAALGAMMSARAVLPHMTARGSGAIIFTGATAGLRGGANFGKIRAAGFCAIAGARIRTQGHPCRACRARRVDRRGSDRPEIWYVAGEPDGTAGHCTGLSRPCKAGRFGVDSRNGPAAVLRTLLRRV
jgi:NAD(P)-dependent dehydrogenase (short-subunit alcohol dehydrogenase family)